MSGDRIIDTLTGEEIKVTPLIGHYPCGCWRGEGDPDHCQECYPNGDDPNADLIGFQYVTAEGTPAKETVTVIGTPAWSKDNGGQYVTVRFPTGHETIKLAGAVRRRKELDS